MEKSLGPPAAPGQFPEEHQDPAVGRPGRSLVVESLGQDALAGAVGLHDADEELPPDCLVKAMRSPRGDQTGVA